MKKILLGIAATAGLFFAASCAKEPVTGALSGEETLVSFSVGLDDVLSTRAISDGMTVDKLTYLVLNADDEAVGAPGTTGISNKTANVRISLVKGKKYTVVFWAQKGETDFYDLSDFPKVTVNYTGALNNDEARDAFYAAHKIESVDGTPQTVTLKRPFAQINVGIEKDETAPAVAKTQMTVTDAHSKIDLLTGTVSEKVLDKVVFGYADVPTEDLTAGEKDYTYLSMSYVLVNGNVGVTVSFQNEAGTAALKDLVEANTPVAMNYRTNFLGSASTTDVDFTVTVDPDYGDPDNDEENFPMKPGDGEEEAKSQIVVSNILAEYKDGKVTFSAEYTNPKDEEIKEAWFVYAPATDILSRAGENENKVKATVNTNEKTLTAESEDIEPGSYVVTVEMTVEIEGKEITVTSTDNADTSASGDVTVPEEEKPEHGTTAEDPLTVAEAIAKAQETGTTATNEAYYIQGVVVSVKEHSAQYGNVTFNIVDKGSSDAFTAFQVKWLDGEQWTADKGYVNIGDEVIVYGQIVNYQNNTPETQQNTGYLYQFISHAPTLSKVEVTVGDDGTSATFKATYTNIENVSITKAGFKYGEYTAEVAVPVGAAGELTAEVKDIPVGDYSVVAYLDEYESVSATGFSIKDANVTYVYKKVTSNEELTDGTYLIVSEKEKWALDGSLDKLDAEGNRFVVTIIDDKIASSDDTDARIFTFNATNGSFKSASGYYIGSTADANELKTSQTMEYTNTITFESNGDANIKGTSSYLRYNPTDSSGNRRFRYYKATTYTSQDAIQLYKKVVAE